MDADVIVAGAGLAGLSCGFELAEEGRRVLVLEAQPWTGGRTSSWIEPDGMRVESGLHRVLGVYRALPELLRRAGVDWDEIVIWEDEVEFRQPRPAPSAVLAAAPMKNLVQTLADVAGHNDYLPIAAKLSFSRFVLQGLADYTDRPAWLDAQSVRDYATALDVHPEVFSKVLEPLVSGIYFVSASRMSAYAFIALIAPYLDNAASMRVGAFAGGMTEVMTDPLAEAIRRRGGEVVTNAPVEELIVENDRVVGVRAGGRGASRATRRSGDFDTGGAGLGAGEIWRSGMDGRIVEAGHDAGGDVATGVGRAVDGGGSHDVWGGDIAGMF